MQDACSPEGVISGGALLSRGGLYDAERGNIMKERPNFGETLTIVADREADLGLGLAIEGKVIDFII